MVLVICTSGECGPRSTAPSYSFPLVSNGTSRFGSSLAASESSFLASLSSSVDLATKLVSLLLTQAARPAGPDLEEFPLIEAAGRPIRLRSDLALDGVCQEES
jgi:hypothetical protein